MTPDIEELLQDLKGENELLRQEATAQLWSIWFHQKGEIGLELLSRAQNALDSGDIKRAESILTDAITDFPDFAEARNRRAVLYYTIGEYEKSQRDCQEVVKLIPYHFGAWHGLGLCYAALGNYRSAISAFRQAANIQPHALVNQRLILECTALLN